MQNETKLECKDLTARATELFQREANETEKTQPAGRVGAQTWWDIVGQVQHGQEGKRCGYETNTDGGSQVSSMQGFNQSSIGD